MTVWKEGNFCFKEPPFQDGDVVEGGNCMQMVAGTEICKAVKNLTITGGNFLNCKPQNGWTVTGGLWCSKEFCSHEHPKWVAKGLKKCAVDCKHRSPAKVEREVDEATFRKRKAALAESSIDKTVDADGVTVQVFTVTEYEYEDKLVPGGVDVMGRVR